MFQLFFEFISFELFWTSLFFWVFFKSFVFFFEVSSFFWIVGLNFWVFFFFVFFLFFFFERIVTFRSGPGSQLATTYQIFMALDPLDRGLTILEPAWCICQRLSRAPGSPGSPVSEHRNVPMDALGLTLRNSSAIRRIIQIIWCARGKEWWHFVLVSRAG